MSEEKKYPIIMFDVEKKLRNNEHLTGEELNWLLLRLYESQKLTDREVNKIYNEVFPDPPDTDDVHPYWESE